MQPTSRNKIINWSIFFLLAFIWGSSFILMKEGLKKLDAYQVASIRMLSGGLVLLPVGLARIKKIPKNKILLVLTSGLLGSFFPAYLFCIAEVKISSSLAGFLNALTPVFTIIIGISFFHFAFKKSSLPGVLIALTGMVTLFMAQGVSGLQNLGYSIFVIVATICYAINVNLVNRYLKEIGSTNIAAVAFTLLIIPSALILFFTGFFSLPLGNSDVLYSTMSASILGIFGTAIASILFYILLKRAGTLFASMVTYGIPFIALFWGLVAGEMITMLQIIGLLIILVGVYLANR